MNRYGVKLAWLAFNVSMDEIQTWLTTNMPTYTALLTTSSNYLIIKFDSTPTNTELTTLKTWWNAILVTDAEATKYVSQATVTQAIKDARTAAMSKNWDVMSTAERKSLAGLTPTLIELGL